MASFEWGRLLIRIAVWTVIGAVVGGFLGFLLGTYSPETYEAWFSPEVVAHSGAVWIGVSLGVPQGAGVGCVIGLLSYILPWFKGIASSKAVVEATFDASTNTVRLKGRTRSAILVLGVWAPSELDALCLFENPTVVTDEGLVVTGLVWRKQDGTPCEPPKSGRLGAYAVSPNVQP